MQVTVRNGWIFSPRVDLLVFGLPVLAGVLLLLVNQLYKIDNVQVFNRDLLVMMLAILAFIDSAHVFSTLFRTYLDKEQRTERGLLLYGLPLLTYGVMVLVYQLFGFNTVLICFGYYNVYHVVRQQYGWISLSARKGHDTGKDFWLDRMTIYAFMVLPVIWVHFSIPANEKQISIPKSPLIADCIVGLWISIFVIYYCRQVIKMFSGQTINLPKQMLMLLSFVTWGAVIFFQSPLLIFAPVLLHSIPYMTIVYKSSIGKKIATLRGVVFTMLIFISVTLLLGVLYTKTNNFLKGIDNGWIWGIPKAYFLFLFMVFPLMHFLIDGVIWKRKYYKV